MKNLKKIKYLYTIGKFLLKNNNKKNYKIKYKKIASHNGKILYHLGRIKLRNIKKSFI